VRSAAPADQSIGISSKCRLTGGFWNRIFKQRQPAIRAELETLIEFESDSQVGETLDFLVYCAKEPDARAAAKFTLQTILKIVRDPVAE